MNPRRQSTVHDLAALRLHRDGSRILNSDTNLSSRRAKYATRDARGNWIAQDAGGLGTVKLRRSASQPDVDQDAVSEHAADEEVFDDSHSRPSRDKGKGRADDRELEEELDALNPRARKRRRFDEDMGYLDSRPSLPTTPRSDGEPLPSLDQETHPGCMPTPSSDTLKCLHYFASTYYTAMGQLYDATKEVRMQRKLRKAQKLELSSSRASSMEVIDVDDTGHDDDEAVDEGEDEPGHEPSGEDGKSGTRKPGKRQRRPKESRSLDKDMYKIFDGSALMALGMLLQEHVAGLLELNVPEGWDKEMLIAERERTAETRKSRNAMRMKDRRHTVKAEGSTARDDVESEDEVETEGRHRKENEADDDTEEDEPEDDEDEDSQHSGQLGRHTSAHSSSEYESDN